MYVIDAAHLFPAWMFSWEDTYQGAPFPALSWEELCKGALTAMWCPAQRTLFQLWNVEALLVQRHAVWCQMCVSSHQALWVIP